MNAAECIILDNGSYTMKVGLGNDQIPKVIPNCIFKSKLERKRVYVGNEIEYCPDHSSLYMVFPCEKGYPVNWEVQQKLWDKAFAEHMDSLSSMSLLLSDRNCLIPAIVDKSNEILFEHYQFGALYKASAMSFAAAVTDVSLVVDCGYSCTTVAAFVNGTPLSKSVIRIDIGGKQLTNQLKDWISYRDINVMEETYVVNECKEDVCFVSLNFEEDLRRAKSHNRKPFYVEYGLPDFHRTFRGFIKGERADQCSDEDQVLRLNHERFALPECLFRPSDLKIHQMGVAEAAAESVMKCPENMRNALCGNVILLGGSTKFPGFSERFVSEFSTLVNSSYNVGLAHVDDAVIHAWLSARNLIANNYFESRFITQAQYQEYGSDVAVNENFWKFIDLPFTS